MLDIWDFENDEGGGDGELPDRMYDEDSENGEEENNGTG